MHRGDGRIGIRCPARSRPSSSMHRGIRRIHLAISHRHANDPLMWPVDAQTPIVGVPIVVLTVRCHAHFCLRHFRSHHRIAAADAQRLAGDERMPRRRQEIELPGATSSGVPTRPERVSLADPAPHILLEPDLHFCSPTGSARTDFLAGGRQRGSGAHHVETDVLACRFPSRAISESAITPALHAAIDGLAELADPAGIGGDAHHRAL